VDLSAASSVRDGLRAPELGLGAALSDDYVYRPPSDVSGDSADGHDRDPSASKIRRLLDRQREMGRQLVAQRADFESQIAELEAKLAAGWSDAARTKLEAELEASRRRCEAYRKRLSRRENRAEPGPAAPADRPRSAALCESTASFS
jgi:uncharacterized membrane protein YccC